MPCSRCARRKRRSHDPALLDRRLRRRGRRPELGAVRPGRAACTGLSRVHPPACAATAPTRSASTPTTVRAEADAGVAARGTGARTTDRSLQRAARRHPCARPRPRRRRTVRHAAAGRPRRRRHQGQPAARRLLDAHPHRDGLQPRQAQHRAQPQGSRGDGDPARAVAGPTSCSTTCATTRRSASASTTSHSQAINPTVDLLPHPRLRARRAASACPATTRPVPRSPGATGSTAASTRAAGRSGRSRRWATPATASSPPSAWCRRSTTATAPAKASSSTRRSCTRTCSTRRTRGHRRRHTPRTARASTRSSSVTALYRLYETQDGWLCVAALTDQHWEHLCKALGRDDLLGDARGSRPQPIARPTTPRSGPRSTTRSRRAPRPTGSSASTPPVCRARSPTTRSRSGCSTIPS